MEQIRSLTKKRNAVGTVTTVGMSANWSQLDSDPQENTQVKSLLDIDISPLKGGINPENCIKMRQNWAALQIGAHGAILATDPLRSFPLYWTRTEEGVAISDSCFALAKKIGARPNRKVTNYMRYTGFCPGEETFFAGISCLSPGTILHLDSSGKEVSRIFYDDNSFTVKPAITDELFFRKELEKNLDLVMNRMLASIGSSRILLPLSGGLDSRLLATWLVNQGVNNLLAFSYGDSANQPEAKISREVASRLGIPFEFVELSSQRVHSYWQRKETAELLRYASSGNALPHIQDFIALQTLLDKGQTSPGDVLLPGHTVVGNMHNLELLEQTNTTFKDITHAVIRNHMGLRYGRPPQSIQNQMRDDLLTLANHLDFDGTLRSTQRLVEAFNLHERQTKYINNSMKIYEYLGLRWALPMLDREFAACWFSGAVELTASREFYKRWINALYDAKTGKSNPLYGASRLPIPGFIRPLAIKLAHLSHLDVLVSHLRSVHLTMNHPLGFTKYLPKMNRLELASRLLFEGPIMGIWTREFLHGRWHQDLDIFDQVDS